MYDGFAVNQFDWRKPNGNHFHLLFLNARCRTIFSVCHTSYRSVQFRFSCAETRPQVTKHEKNEKYQIIDEKSISHRFDVTFDGCSLISIFRMIFNENNEIG